MTIGDKYYNSPHGAISLWDQALSYSSGDKVVYTDGITYIASGAVASATAWAVGWGANQWHKAIHVRMPLVTVVSVVGTFTPHPEAIYCEVEMVGAGGGGGGCPAWGPGMSSVGAPGGAGAYVKFYLDPYPIAPITVTPGLVGTGGFGGGGVAGTPTTFGAMVSCNGGGGGSAGSFENDNGIHKWGGAGGTGITVNAGAVELSRRAGNSGAYATAGASGLFVGAGGDSFMAPGDAGILAATPKATVTANQDFPSLAARGSGGGGTSYNSNWSDGLTEGPGIGNPGGAGLVIITERF